MSDEQKQSRWIHEPYGRLGRERIKDNQIVNASGGSHISDVTQIQAETYNRINVFATPLLLPMPRQMPPIPRHVVPRPSAEQEIKALLLADEAPRVGVLAATVVHGLGGVGKSTLIATLARDPEVLERFSDGVLWALLGQQPDLLSLLRGWLHALNVYSLNPTTIQEATSHLNTLLQDRSTLLVIDDAWDPAHVKPFLVAGPRSHIVITTREAPIARALHLKAYELEVMRPEESLALLSARIGRDLVEREQNQAKTMANMVGHLPLALELVAAHIAEGTSWSEFEDALTAEVAELETLDLLEAEEVVQIANEQMQKSLSLRASLYLSLRRISQERLERFGWLGVLPEDTILTPALASTLWNLDPLAARHELFALRDRALLQSGLPLLDNLTATHPTPTFLIHDLFHDLARQVLISPVIPVRQGDLPGVGLSLQEAHNSFLGRYKSRYNNAKSNGPHPPRGTVDIHDAYDADTASWSWCALPNDGYIHGHLTWHLEQAGQFDQIHSLLSEETAEGENAWYQVRIRAGEGTGYLLDITRAWRLSEVDSQHTLEANIHQTQEEQLQTARTQSESSLEIGESIALQVRYALVTASINSLTGKIPARLVLALLEQGWWTHSQALASVKQIDEVEEQIEALTVLMPFLSDYLPEPQKYQLMAEVLTSVQRSSCNCMGWALQNLAPYLPEVLLHKALSLQLEDSMRLLDDAKALTALASRLPDPQKGEVLIRALDKVVGVSRTGNVEPNELESSDTSRSRSLQFLDDAEVIATLSRALAEAGHTERALAAVELIYESSYIRIEALAAISRHLPEHEKAAVLNEVLNTAGAINYYHDRCIALLGLVPYVTEPHKDKLLRKALRLVKGLEGYPEIAERLIAVLPQMPESERGKVLRRALKTIEAEVEEVLERERDGTWVAQAFVILAPQIPESLLPKALTVAQGMEADLGKALAAVVTRLAQTGQAQKALEAARQIEWPEFRADMLATISSYLPEPDRLELLIEALDTLPIDDTNDQAKAIESIAVGLAGLGQAHAALNIVMGIMQDENRLTALTNLVVHLAEPTRSEALNEAYYIAQRAVKEATKSKLFKSGTLKSLLALLDENGKSKEAMELAVMAGSKSATLNDLSEEDLEQERTDALQDLSLRFAQAGAVSEALEAARAITSEGERSEAMAVLSSLLSEPTKSQLIRETSHIVRSISDIEQRIYSSIQLLDYLDEPARSELISEVLNIIPSLETEIQRGWENDFEIEASYRQALALTYLLPYLPRLRSSKVRSQALNVAMQINDPYARAQALLRLMPYLAGQEKGKVARKVINSAERIPLSSSRASVLLDLTDYLVGQIKSEVLGLVVDATRQMVRDGSFRFQIVSWLRELVPKLPESTKNEVWNDILDDVKQYSLQSQSTWMLEQLVFLVSVVPNDLLWRVLEIVQAFQSVTKRAEALARMVEILPEPLRGAAIQELGDIVLTVDGELQYALSPEAASILRAELPEPERNAVKKVLQPEIERKSLAALNPKQVAELPLPVINSLLQEALHESARSKRWVLLSDIAAVVPVLVVWGGEVALTRIADAVNDVGRWWR